MRPRRRRGSRGARGRLPLARASGRALLTAVRGWAPRRPRPSGGSFPRASSASTMREPRQERPKEGGAPQRVVREALGVLGRYHWSSHNGGCSGKTFKLIFRCDAGALPRGSAQPAARARGGAIAAAGAGRGTGELSPHDRPRPHSGASGGDRCGCCRIRFACAKAHVVCSPVTQVPQSGHAAAAPSAQPPRRTTVC